MSFPVRSGRHWTGGERGLAALFQSVSPRTAGFNTVDLTQLSAGSQLMTILLMLAGGLSRLHRRGI